MLCVAAQLPEDTKINDIKLIGLVSKTYLHSCLATLHYLQVYATIKSQLELNCKYYYTVHALAVFWFIRVMVWKTLCNVIGIV